jgi:DNA-binding CsgD family transcriptional regulator
MLEFFLDQNNGTDIIINEDGKFSTFHEKHPLMDHLYKSIQDNYTEAFEALQDTYGNARSFKYLMVKRFLKCNFSKHDEVADIDSNGHFHTEFVSCPLRGECKHEGIICGAKINTSLSEREMEVLNLIIEGATDFEVAEQLFLSPFTAKNHRRNIQIKTKTKNTAALVAYAKDNNLLP